jgi:hypothetical protein
LITWSSPIKGFIKELFNFFKDLNTLKETNEPENTLIVDPTITAELNVNGLQNREKRGRAIEWIKSMKCDIAYFQETHFDQNIENMFLKVLLFGA